MRFPTTLPVVLALATGWSCAHAAADFTTIRRTQINMSDAVPSLVLTFTLPTTLNRSTSTANSAVLDAEVLGLEFNRNEIYVNPPTLVCTDDDTDANQAGSVGVLQEHDDINLKTEWSANHMTFSSGLLQTGTNQLLVCIRTIDGEAGSNVGNLDDISLRNMVLHYHTTQ
jgi:hypothetical protein